MATIYLAARFVRREELLKYKADLEEAGHDVTSRWLTEPDGPNAAVSAQFERGARPREAVQLAQNDVEDIARAEVIISFSEPPLADLSAARGGRHVEFGIAWAWAKQMVVVGPVENLFHMLPSVRVFSDWGLCLANLDALVTARRELFRPLDEMVADA